MDQIEYNSWHTALENTFYLRNPNEHKRLCEEYAKVIARKITTQQILKEKSNIESKISLEDDHSKEQ